MSTDRDGRRLVVDWTRCDGHGLCRVLLPDLVDVDEWGFPLVRDPAVPAPLEADARRAAAACPALALRLDRLEHLDRLDRTGG